MLWSSSTAARSLSHPKTCFFCPRVCTFAWRQNNGPQSKGTSDTAPGTKKEERRTISTRGTRGRRYQGRGFERGECVWGRQTRRLEYFGDIAMHTYCRPAKRNKHLSLMAPTSSSIHAVMRNYHVGAVSRSLLWLEHATLWTVAVRRCNTAYVALLLERQKKQAGHWSRYISCLKSTLLCQGCATNKLKDGRRPRQVLGKRKLAQRFHSDPGSSAPDWPQITLPVQSTTNTLRHLLGQRSNTRVIRVRMATAVVLQRSRGYRRGPRRVDNKQQAQNRRATKWPRQNIVPPAGTRCTVCAVRTSTFVSRRLFFLGD